MGTTAARTFITRANLSRQLPTAMSIVSPNILYRLCEYAMTCRGTKENKAQIGKKTGNVKLEQTCVFPPLTYSTVGLSARVMSRPISMCPMQWLTPSSGFPQSCATVRATSATVTRGAPIPGPGGQDGNTWREKNGAPVLCYRQKELWFHATFGVGHTVDVSWF